ncbi:MAG: energy-coupling factor transporter transmembrane component T [Planctomycetota bacterium]
MDRIANAIDDVGLLDRLAGLDSPVHRRDPRALMIVTALFLVTVVSFPVYAFAELMPMAVYPIAMLAVAGIPFRIPVRYILLAAPFAVLVGFFNPLFDRDIVARWGPVAVSGGWLSFLSIIARYLLTVSAALVLLACAGYAAVCVALGRFGLPRVLVTQFLLLYRFLFVLADEGQRAVRAHALRSRSHRPAAFRVWGSLAGHLLLRAFDRGTRTHAAMRARGFDGTLRLIRDWRWSWADTAFVAACGGYFALVRFGHVAERIGRFVMERAA